MNGILKFVKCVDLEKLTSVLGRISSIERYGHPVKQVIYTGLSILLTVTYSFTNKLQKKGVIFAPPIDVDR